MIMLNYFDVITRAQKGYSRYLEPVCRVWDLTRNEMDVLLFLHNNPAMDRAVDIVTHRGIAKSHVSLSVSTLEAKALLCRQEDPQDRRTVRLKLTDRGQQAAREGHDAQRAFFDRIHQGVTAEEMAIWNSISHKVSENIKNMED